MNCFLSSLSQSTFVFLCCTTGLSGKIAKLDSDLTKLAPESYLLKKEGNLPFPLSESSGLALSRIHHGWCWGHNDSGNLPQLFLFKISEQKEASTEYHWKTVFPGKTVNQDWEDLHMSPDEILVLANTGNNLKNRSQLELITFKEPENLEYVQTIHADRHVFEYERLGNQNKIARKDCEAICAVGDDLLLFTKRLVANYSDVYMIRDFLKNEAIEDKKTVLRAEFVIRLKGVWGVTGADSWNSGAKIALLNYNSVLVFENAAESNLKSFFESGKKVPLPFSQYEAIAFKDENNLILSNEKGELFILNLR